MFIPARVISCYIKIQSFGYVSCLKVENFFKGRPGVRTSDGSDGRFPRALVQLALRLLIRPIHMRREEFIAGGGVYNLVYPRQTEGVFRIVFVKIGVINAHSLFFF